MDAELRELEKAAAANPDDPSVGVAYAMALGRVGERRRQFREWRRLARLGVREATRALDSWWITGAELAAALASPLDRWSPLIEFVTA